MYLTNTQFQRLGVSRSARSLNALLNDLERRKLIRAIRFDGVPRRETFYCLAERGASWLEVEMGNEVKLSLYPKSTRGFDRDFFHRKLTVDFHIALVKWIRKKNDPLGQEQGHRSRHQPLSLPVFDRYFDVTGANRTHDPIRSRLAAKTRVLIDRKRKVIPDVNFVMADRR
ncbi:hypothetical protein SCOR_27375 [Sulfidibacter corallicola]|uniref:Uncharacterized protein n=1 Tax=Sulfidibacter corallicola TaxID=2818388 RepID=A0A8A4TW24_SULCO|nr:hypothetical protein [Sulfidibacter corallicola]QTD50725.1 hypothetical protein J3U87_34500 [Sulfidibacter corallicola]